MEEQAIRLNRIEEVLEDLKQGKVIIVVDDEDRENEGDFIAAAEKVTPEMINFMTQHGRGLLCAPLEEDRCEKLGLNMMVTHNTVLHHTPFTVSVDLLGKGCTTGISTHDRSKTIQALVDEETRPQDLGRPGHIFPLRAKKGGVLRRAGHTEAAVDLARLAGLKPAGILIEILNEDGTMARLPQLMKVAEKFDLKIVSIQDLIAYRLKNESLIQKIDSVKFQTHYGEYDLIAYKQTTNNQIHFALTKGEWTEDESVPVRVKSTNDYFDLFTALHKGEQPLLEKITQIINKEGKGVLVFINNAIDSDLVQAKFNHYKAYLEGTQENPLKAPDTKDYGIGAQILKDLGIQKMKLITKTPDSKKAIGGYDLEITDFIEI
ncbi:3,4-dihydroxy-2-butanone-4-phosphate synthase [Ornithobacterium rhinotracheale]|uniref:3,4-dihydroxy-2-butanone 4-phosphate synthase n=1 Tax=Ornithobacterium rhinotracheale (strain ATCC 51463 / DSM 15997 / CCUG 23171 / CIP 104009 / LMG 9086) TaxID=867902 RepID=I4A2A2_ORNRL|nr:3,4-dihydroxy-2-butanone-4-phosphate synthase [Ornithobacterium rhinotracheale]AFL98086.1 3,4-dihydroxy-2-butanone 4-phosphate synthase [Ornithobacterium rhinotracheale DSM 15997]AIP99858.1 3,4-dihydroxy-2-butanone 4-phosphate synthase [Ornithobacterium rhinotracheale ORT-UMN 88]KGB66046.1 3,4-dihydroxy-2-butanone 4-phosphate synthase [Ornithobacterium rhinotracheale H06-030791]MCK0193621.1 3,4-dihydroxy-2-butanone-4-phosphate synthase [Ornithobacterium rhinotracheale]MCK0199257.1 3,4-dihyd